ncbi:acetylornithine deacetylase [Naumannella halotolerans]|uniref:Acetylornithine deacetylase n=1 Tax=Naumannella halotolerans TaxID=993414 RepID=A0A4V3EMU7_9ACTN|nr:acetylornithine deacetylase [Naumannella halotolerans]TDT31238.1 acetylornithine deacetylase [Naumannella halotolerans]
MTNLRSLPWIERLVGIDTTSRNSNLELIELVAAAFREHGIEPHTFPTPDGKKANLIATVPAADGTISGGVVLSGHTDVVPVDGQDWDSDPFSVKITEDKLFGRGVADMKSFIAVALTWLPEIVAAELSEPIHFAFTYDEELGCLGGEEIVKQIADLGLSPRIAFIGEPTSMQVVRGHKSVNLIKATFTGVTAHSSLTSAGVNAIEYAAKLITYFRDYTQKWKTEGPFDEEFLLPYSTGGSNVINGGTASNIIPAEAVVELDFRTIGAVDPDTVIGDVFAKIAELDEQMKAENPAAGATAVVPSKVPGLDTGTDSDAVAFGALLGVDSSEVKVTYGTEAGQFAGTGIAAVVVGPGDIAQAHTANEWIAVDQIEKCEKFIGELIHELSRPS